MIFDSLTLHNFGVYRGEHRIDLTPTAMKPVVLVGALNGSGKTTLLDAFQLVLFGKLARVSSRGRLGFPEYLLQCINRAVDPAAGAGLTLEFRHRRGGHEERYRVNRTWRATNSGVKENLEVTRNDFVDAAATERWQEFVEEFLPSQMADLFFFDGEKIEALADLDRSADLLRVGVHSLLGLDLVDQLSRSLTVLERRRRAGLGAGHDSTRIRALETEVETLNGQADFILQTIGATQNELDLGKKTIEGLASQFRAQGGELYSQRAVLESRLADSQSLKNTYAEELRTMAAGDAPLLLVNGLIEEAHGHARREHDASVARAVLDVIAHRDSELQTLMSNLAHPAKVKDAVGRFLRTSRAALEAAADEAPVLNVELAAFGALSNDRLKAVRTSLAAKVWDYRRAVGEVTVNNANLLAVPSENAIAHLVADLEDARQRQAELNGKIQALQQERQRLLGELERRKMELQSEHDAYVSARLGDEVAERMILHAKQSRETLARFRSEVAIRNLARLEGLIANSFKQLLRKSDLIKAVHIDPTTFVLQIRDAHGHRVPPVRLSAGERQLLAVAILWSLAKASGRMLPTVIDTPLGRLDGQHRKFLVRNYFPKASHQVILLSTDEEIAGPYYEALRPAISREYLISHDEELRSSVIKSGYFIREAAVA